MLPTLAAVVEELDRFPDARLLAMFVFALSRCARNMATGRAIERGWPAGGSAAGVSAAAG